MSPRYPMEREEFRTDLWTPLPLVREFLERCFRIADLLVDCLNPARSATLGKRLQTLTSSDWDNFLSQARWHNVSPILYKCLLTTGVAAYMPQVILEQLKGDYQQNTARNRQVFRELADILKIFRNEGLPCIVLKGPHLAQVVYEDIGQRLMADIDLLVKKGDLPAVRRVFSALRYELKPCVFTKEREWVEEADSHFGYLKEGCIPVEVHWSLHDFNPSLCLSRRVSALPMSDLEGLWQSARPENLGGVETLVLAPPDLLLLSCAYVSYHKLFNRGIRPMYDIAAILRKYGRSLDCDAFHGAAREYGVGGFTHYTLLAVEKMFGITLPANLASGLSTGPFDPRLVKAMIDYVLAFPLLPILWSYGMPGMPFELAAAYYNLERGADAGSGKPHQPVDVSAYNEIGDAHNSLRHYFAAIWAYEEVVRMDPGNSEVRFRLGELYLKTLWLDLAKEEYEVLLKSAPHLARRLHELMYPEEKSGH